MYIPLRAFLICLLASLALNLSATDNNNCLDCADYADATQVVSLSAHTSLIYAQATHIPYEIILNYHRRRTDPDSILKAAQDLLLAAPAFSKTYAFAAFSAAESHLHLFNEAKYKLARSLLQVDQYTAELHPLVNFYLLLLDATYDHKFTLNTERISIRLLNAIDRAKTFHPEMIPQLTVTLCEAYSYLGLFHLIIDRVKDFKETFKPQIQDELDAIKYDHYLARMLYYLQRYQRSGNLQEQAAQRLLQYPERLASLIADCNYYAAEACYRQHRDQRCLPRFEEAVKGRRRKNYLEMYVAILYHTQQYDRVIAECQQFFTQVFPGFSPAGPLDNPDISNIILGGEYPGNLLMWKGRALYKKSLDKSDQEAIPLLECGFASAESGRILHNQIMFGADGYKMAQLILNNQLTYGLGYQVRIAYQLWLRTKQHTYKKLFFRYMEMRKNYLLSGAFSHNHLPEAARKKQTKCMKELESLEYKYMRAPKDSSAWYHKALMARSMALDQCIAALQQQYPRLITDHAQLSYADPDELQQKLDDTTAMLVCAQQWRHYYVYCITSNSQKLLKVYHGTALPDWLATLTQTASDPLQLQKSKREKFIRAAHQIYTVFLAPFEKELEGKKRLVIIPEDSNGQIPFEILLDSDEYRPYEQLNFLIKNYETSYHYSATFYDKANQSSIRDGSFLGFAPVFEDGGTIDSPIRSSRFFRNRSTASIKKRSFTSLPGTAKEVTTIASLMPPNSRQTVLLRSEATETKLKKELSQPYQYIHLATHGLPDLLDPRLSAFACYDTKGEKGSFLFAHYIESLDLNTDLAVLSSCESGVGMILEGENIIALSRSFLAAGAKNIVYSLWKVDDKTSSDLMINFYRRHLNGESYATALRKVKLALISDPATAAPRLWAPFVLVGK